jgi:HAD superfamily hydrolase (TIGR01509 family)
VIRGVIFDLGGTLAELTAPQEADQLDRRNAGALLRWLRGRGLQADDGFVDALVAERRMCFERRAAGLREVTAIEALIPVLERHGLPHHEPFVAAAETAFFEPELSSMRSLPGAEELLRWARGMDLRTGVASNASSHHFVVECCRKLGFADFLDPIVSSAQVGWAKPHPKIFETILSAWSLPPEQVVMVGDTLTADIAGARRMGMRNILLVTAPAPRPPENAEVKPDAVASALSDVQRILQDWITRKH